MYSISYYANTPNVPDRGKTHLRKNPAKHPVNKVDGGIPTKSEAWHVVTIVSARAGKIEFWIDDSLILSHEDKDESPYTSGWLGFRQMKWSHFAYSDLKIWDWGDKTKAYNVKRSERSCVIFKIIYYQHTLLRTSSRTRQRFNSYTHTHTHTIHHQSLKTFNNFSRH